MEEHTFVLIVSKIFIIYIRFIGFLIICVKTIQILKAGNIIEHFDPIIFDTSHIAIEKVKILEVFKFFLSFTFEEEFTESVIRGTHRSKDYRINDKVKLWLTRGSRDSRSLILLPLRLRWVSFGLPCRKLRPPEIRLSLSSNFWRLGNLGNPFKLVRPTLIKLSDSKLTNSSVNPTMVVLRQLSKLSSLIYVYHQDYSTLRERDMMCVRESEKERAKKRRKKIVR